MKSYSTTPPLDKAARKNKIVLMKIEYIRKIVGKNSIHEGDLVKTTRDASGLVATGFKYRGIILRMEVILAGRPQRIGTHISNGTEVFVYCPHKK